MAISRAEVITSVERRRWSRDEKERLVAASLDPGATVSEVARMAGLHVSQLFRWRKELCKVSGKETPSGEVDERSAIGCGVCEPM
ncbi:hypothetical protein BKD09_42080 [Bradyrhizobium japonicum]|uniref:Transposase n=1 Tax=Bradyrhizobium japonicum TaxID=375 RepID=A0A1L3FNS8_BRAJP|nr:transposase [Bradyrhizobium japonicum]APG14931.1 hypothetical protein BKD09_42080 [Bradyrhizobium japonicum]